MTLSKLNETIMNGISLSIDPTSSLGHFQAIISSSDDAIVSKTLTGVITSWNSGAEKIFGYSSEEMVGTSILRLLPSDRLDEESMIIERIRNGEKVDHFETKRVRKDGVEIDVSVTISPLRNEAGQIIGASKIARDITERKAAEAKLKLTSKVFSASSEAIVILDRRGLIVDVNDSFTRISGYEREEVVGKNLKILRSSRQGPEVFKQINADLKATGHSQIEIWSRRKDGAAYAGLFTVSAVRDAGSVVNYVALFADTTTLKLQQEKLEHVAHFDVLTDLPNRLLLTDRLQQGVMLSNRLNQSLAILYLDLDGFKVVNDKHGHDVGDELLIALAHRMKSAMQEADTLARIGGDEFVALLHDVGDQRACGLLIGRILKACSDPISLRGNLFKVSTSIGATIYPNDSANADELIRHADQAMYEAKLSGRNCYRLFDAAHHGQIKNRVKELERIGRALEQDEFVLYFQPKVNMRTGAVIGAEALIRWQCPNRELISPAAFLPAIEGHELSDKLDQWVIDRALHQMSVWSKAGFVLPISVNIGPRQLHQDLFPTLLAEALAKYPVVNPASLELEILETSAMTDIEKVSGIMRRCHQLGVHFSVDDFGTGYSSLTYLKRLPAETLKIDQSFVRDMLEDSEDLAIVTGIIGLALAFNRQVIAEGVESVGHGVKLLQLGCDLAQGYGISRPMPSEQLCGWATTWKPPIEWTEAMSADYSAR